MSKARWRSVANALAGRNSAVRGGAEVVGEVVVDVDAGADDDGSVEWYGDTDD
ncbi:MAG TPA: hypothetical protein VLK34_01615 [Nocardioidaceae bacterium]|nr:hypothetical protein [Nocardioidaceae bacterium]